MELPDRLRCVFSAPVDAQSDDTYTLEIPKQEIELGAIQPGTVYRLALLAPVDTATPGASPTTTANTDSERGGTGPPVNKGEIRTVEIDDLGEQGDGIARVEHGYVLIIPDTTQGERVKIEITTVRSNVAFGEVRERLATPPQRQPE